MPKTEVVGTYYDAERDEITQVINDDGEIAINRMPVEEFFAVVGENARVVDRTIKVDSPVGEISVPFEQAEVEAISEYYEEQWALKNGRRADLDRDKAEVHAR